MRIQDTASGRERLKTTDWGGGTAGGKCRTEIRQEDAMSLLMSV